MKNLDTPQKAFIVTFVIAFVFLAYDLNHWTLYNWTKFLGEQQYSRVLNVFAQIGFMSAIAGFMAFGAAKIFKKSA